MRDKRRSCFCLLGPLSLSFSPDFLPVNFFSPLPLASHISLLESSERVSFRVRDESSLSLGDEGDCRNLSGRLCVCVQIGLNCGENDTTISLRMWGIRARSVCV